MTNDQPAGVDHPPTPADGPHIRVSRCQTGHQARVCARAMPTGVASLAALVSLGLYTWALERGTVLAAAASGHLALTWEKGFLFRRDFRDPASGSVSHPGVEMGGNAFPGSRSHQDTLSKALPFLPAASSSAQWPPCIQ